MHSPLVTRATCSRGACCTGFSVVAGLTTVSMLLGGAGPQPVFFFFLFFFFDSMPYVVALTPAEGWNRVFIGLVTRLRGAWGSCQPPSGRAGSLCFCLAWDIMYLFQFQCLLFKQCFYLNLFISSRTINTLNVEPIFYLSLQNLALQSLNKQFLKSKSAWLNKWMNTI